MNETDLRTALHELGDVPAPPDLAGAALARARRDRRRTLTRLVAGVAVLAAAAATVPVLVLGRTAPAESAAAGTAHVIVAGFASRNPQETTLNLGEHRLYDRAAGRYVATPWRSAVPSPDGRQVAVETVSSGGSEKVGVVAADRVQDRSAVRWIAGGRGPGVWSPDSSRLFLGDFLRRKAEPGTVHRVEIQGTVVDARTLAGREVTLTASLPGKSSGSVVFGPGGRGFAVAPSQQAHPPAKSIGVVALFDDNGRATGQVRTGYAAVPDQPFSPDGRLVAVHVGGSPALYAGGSTRVFDIATGAEVGRADGDVVGWVDDDHYAVRVGRSVHVVELKSGRVLAEKVLAPTGRELTGMWLAPLTGAVPPGAVVL